MSDKKNVNPTARYTTTSLVYEQEDILKAVGVAVGKGEWASVNCDGTNKVIIEIHHMRNKP